MLWIIAVIIALIVLVVCLFFVAILRKRSFGTLSRSVVYTDTSKLPGEVMYSEKLHLKGKPDYIILKDGKYIPIEVKTGKTPNAPYKNHIAQLSAYCALIEEKYSVRPKYGVIKYPDREYEVEYTEDAQLQLHRLIQEILEARNSNIEPNCSHTEHNTSRTRIYTSK